MKGAIFDMDGLLLDTEAIYTRGWYALFEAFELEPNASLLRECRGTSGSTLESIIHTYYPDANVSRWLSFLDAFMESERVKGIPLKPGAHHILNHFKEEKVPMAVASSSPLSLIHSCLHQVELNHYFDVFVSSHEACIAHSKPQPDIFLEAANRLHIDIKDCFVFEDAISGVIAGCRAGARTIMIPDLVEPDEHVLRLGIEVYHSLDDFVSTYKNDA